MLCATSSYDAKSIYHISRTMPQLFATANAVKGLSPVAKMHRHRACKSSFIAVFVSGFKRFVNTTHPRRVNLDSMSGRMKFITARPLRRPSGFPATTTTLNQKAPTVRRRFERQTTAALKHTVHLSECNAQQRSSTSQARKH